MPTLSNLAMMIPYFLVLMVLALYGLHRMARFDYYAYQKMFPARRRKSKYGRRHRSASSFQRALRRRAPRRSRFAFSIIQPSSRCAGLTIPPTKPGKRPRCVERHAAQGMPHRLYPPHQSRRLQGPARWKRLGKTAQGESSPSLTPLHARARFPCAARFPYFLAL